LTISIEFGMVIRRVPAPLAEAMVPAAASVAG